MNEIGVFFTAVGIVALCCVRDFWNPALLLMLGLMAVVAFLMCPGVFAYVGMAVCGIVALMCFYGGLAVLCGEDRPFM